MKHSTCTRGPKAAATVLARTVLVFLAITTTALTGPALAAAGDYRFELMNVTPAGAGQSDVTIRLVRVANGLPVADAVISIANAVEIASDRPGYRQFRVEAGVGTLRLMAAVPGRSYVERTFNSSIKAMLTRTVRGKSELVSGSVALGVG